MSNLIRSMALVLPVAFGFSMPTAQALSTGPAYDIFMDGMATGTMTFRNRVVDDGHGRCEYTGRWTGLAGPLMRTRRCKLAEYQAGDFFDCQENRRANFSTILTMPDDYTACSGFDEFGQTTDISALVAGEGPDGHLHGIVVAASIGDVEGLEMVPRSQSRPLVAPPSVKISPLPPVERLP